MAAQAYSQATNIGGSLLRMTGFDDGSYTLFDSGGKTVGSGSAATGGKVEFSSTSSENLYGNFTSTIESFNTSNLNNNLSSEQLTNIVSQGYGNSLDIPSVTTAYSEIAANAGASIAGGFAGSDPGSTSSTAASPGAPGDAPKSSSGPALRYPLATISNQDYVLFERIEYVAGGAAALSSGAVARPSERMTKANVLQTVTLPIPVNVSSDNSVGWGDDKLDMVKALVGGGVVGFMEGGRALDQALSNIGATVNSNKESLKKLLSTGVAGQIAGSNLFTRATGAITNSNLELLFTGPELRSFNFTYRMTPRDAGEADQIKQIIRQFKKGMAPIIAQGQLFVQTPNVFRIKFKFNGNEDHPFLDRVKPCALTNFRANYTPDNSYTTYSNGSPSAYEIAMTFKELDPIYSQDYDSGEGATGMGF